MSTRRLAVLAVVIAWFALARADAPDDAGGAQEARGSAAIGSGATGAATRAPAAGPAGAATRPAATGSAGAAAPPPASGTADPRSPATGSAEAAPRGPATTNRTPAAGSAPRAPGTGSAARSGADAAAGEVTGAGSAGPADSAGDAAGSASGEGSADAGSAGAGSAGAGSAGAGSAGVGSADAGSADAGSATGAAADPADGADAMAGSAEPAIEPETPVVAEPIDLTVVPEPATTETTAETTVFAIKVIGGLVVLLILAYLGGNKRVLRYQQQLGISGLFTAGFPFIALGLIASLPAIGILTGEVLEVVRPILHFGLGWLGFIIGAQLDIRVLDRVPTGSAYMILVETVAPFAITAIGCGAVMIALGQSWDDPAAWRDVILLGTAAAMTAPTRSRGFANRTWREGRSADTLLAQLDDMAGVIGLLFITAFFRAPTANAWQMPSTAWVFVALGVGVAIGVLIFAMVRIPTSNAEFLAVLLGGIAFGSGIAGYLHLSPIVVCFIAGVLVANFPNEQRESIFRILRHLERPVHLLFLIVAGALWSVGDWRGWVLVPVFVVARVLGKWAGIVTSRTVVRERMPGFGTRSLLSPLSGLSIAIVVSVGTDGDSAHGWVVTAVIGGAIVTELLVQAWSAPAGTDHVIRSQIDELDDGPVYRDDDPPSAPTGSPPTR